MDATLKPMLCEPAEVMPADLENWSIEPKWDGWRGIIEHGDTVNVYGGRNGNRYNGKVPYIEEAIASTLPKGTVVDGELVSLTGWGGVQGVMTRKGAHRPCPSEPALSLVVFDILRINGRDLRSLSWANRREVLEMIEWAEPLCLVPTGPASPDAHVRMLDLGMEGSVIKRREAPYQNCRSRDWRKLKAIASEDCKIIGFEDGENGRSGEVGAIKVRLPSGVETTASGMTDKVRADMLANPNNYLDRTVEIVHNGVMDSGKLRHPRFKRMRDDRDDLITPDERAKLNARPAVEPDKPRRPSTPRGPGMRNYGAMGTSKLRDSLSQLEGKYGDAYQRVQAGRYKGTYEEHLLACRAAALSKGVA